ncbi:MAG TPA: hypothetical protein VLW85_05930 [Myxococcales bacterium]|nr:hypothetical protein [Myxococcales bacterium]
MRPSRIIALTILAAALPSAVRAADFQLNTSTQFVGYNDFLSSSQNQGTIAQYVRLNVTSLDEKGRFNVYAYGRIDGQLTTEIESRPELINDSNLYGRLYYLYLDGRNVVPDHLDLKLGRTFVTQAALPSSIDGATINLRNVGAPGVGITAFGGHRVVFDNVTESDNADDLAAGGSVYFDTVRRTHLEASYARQWLKGDYSRDFAAVDVNSVPFDRVNVTGRAKYDVGESRWAELLGNVNVYPFNPLDVPLVLKGEVLVERPTFDQYSFYSYFDVARYQEFGGSAEYEVLPGLRVNGRYAYENFAATKDEVDQHAHVLEAGVVFRKVRNLVVNLSWLNRNGFNSRLSGLRFNAAYALWQKLGLLAGIDFDDFRRDMARDGTSKRYWLGANYDFNKKITASIHAEDDVSYLFTHSFQGLAALVVHL